MKKCCSWAARGSLLLALVLCVFSIMGFMSCDEFAAFLGGGGGGLPQPDIVESYAKVSEDGTVSFTLANVDEYPEGTVFRVYRSNLAVPGAVHSTVTAALVGNLIILSDRNGAVQPGTYYLAAVLDDGTNEGQRIMLEVKAADYEEPSTSKPYNPAVDHPYKNNPAWEMKYAWTEAGGQPFPVEGWVQPNVSSSALALIDEAPAGSVLTLLLYCSGEAGPYFDNQIGTLAKSDDTYVAPVIIPPGTQPVAIGDYVGYVINFTIAELKAAVGTNGTFAFNLWDTRGALGVWLYYPGNPDGPGNPSGPSYDPTVEHPYKNNAAWEMKYAWTEAGWSGEGVKPFPIQGWIQPNVDSSTLALINGAPAGSVLTLLLYCSGEDGPYFGNQIGKLAKSNDTEVAPVVIPAGAQTVAIGDYEGYAINFPIAELKDALNNTSVFAFSLWGARGALGVWLYYPSEPDNPSGPTHPYDGNPAWEMKYAWTEAGWSEEGVKPFPIQGWIQPFVDSSTLALINGAPAGSVLTLLLYCSGDDGPYFGNQIGKLAKSNDDEVTPVVIPVGAQTVAIGGNEGYAINFTVAELKDALNNSNAFGFNLWGVRGALGVWFYYPKS